MRVNESGRVGYSSFNMGYASSHHHVTTLKDFNFALGQIQNHRDSMSAADIPSGSLVILQELNSSSPHFKQGTSLRVTGKLQEYNVETAIAVIADGGATLAVDTQHLRINLRVGSLYQFIGELSIQPSNEGILKARVGRNVDGMDLNLYQQSLKLLRQFQTDQLSHLQQLQ